MSGLAGQVQNKVKESSAVIVPFPTSFILLTTPTITNTNTTLHLLITVSVRAVVGVVVEYTRSLGAVGVTVQHFLYELVINALVRARHFYQLHQLLQYHVLADSKPLVSTDIGKAYVGREGRNGVWGMCRLGRG